LWKQRIMPFGHDSVCPWSHHSGREVGPLTQ
jgi:hypothetical protein